MKATAATGPGSLEQLVLNTLWEGRRLSCGQVRQSLGRRHRKRLAYTTVLTVLDRLYKKGAVDRHKEGRKFVYRPAASRRSYVKSLIQGTVRGLVHRYGQEAVVAFIEEADELTEPPASDGKGDGGGGESAGKGDGKGDGR
ncbi:MAG: CopY family transcriptional regulator [Candidatus Pacebacteria bacterium CG10_big_fil_rev_8_21_14_0_10_56_10]|nr:MAG: CopY family transcriptional regulator [Candidatus Pacebacteria bacterium CG10_big_fil_rev_8_21_14_0_10_56_10]